MKKVRNEVCLPGPGHSSGAQSDGGAGGWCGWGWGGGCGWRWGSGVGWGGRGVRVGPGGAGWLIHSHVAHWHVPPR